MKLAPMRTKQKIAKNTQKADKVTTLMNTIESQKNIVINCPTQNTKTLKDEGTLTCEDSKHHFY